jgi:two-component system KDP operon response regulator KdpE
VSNLPLVLVIDDEVQIRRLLEVTIAANEFRVLLAENAEEGLRTAAMHRPDLIVMDLGLPDLDGRVLLGKLRDWYEGPIIILSVRSSESEIVSLLDAGADDYLVKPFRPFELLARMRVALRHHDVPASEPVVRFGTVEVNLASRVVRKKGQEVKLTSTEYDLLAIFARNVGKILIHRYLLEQVWGALHAEETQYLRVYVAQLRKKLEDDPGQPRHFITESGVGYRLIEEG